MKDGILYLVNLPTRTPQYEVVALDSIDLKRNLDVLGVPQTASEDIVNKKIYVSITGKEEEVFLVFESAILRVTTTLYSPSVQDRTTEERKHDQSQIEVGMSVNEARERLRIMGYPTTLKYFIEQFSMPSIGIRAIDSSKIFTHDGSIFTAANGSIVATTPTALLVITPKDTLSVTYEALFGKIAPFVRPSMDKGRGSSEVFIHDATMTDTTGAVRLELNLKTLHIRVGEESK